MTETPTRLVAEPVMLGDLWGSGGNAWSIMAATTHAMKAAGFSKEALDLYNKVAMGGDYINLLHATDHTVEAYWLDGFTVRPLSEYIEQYEARFPKED